VANDVIAIFDEIYNGPEQFPIHSADGYPRRLERRAPEGHRHRHQSERKLRGLSRRPRRRRLFLEARRKSYSIPPDGDVVRAFRARGWGWGGTTGGRKAIICTFYFGN
jgi:hypothetical protein